MDRHIGYDTPNGYMGKLPDGSWMLFASSTDYDEQLHVYSDEKDRSEKVDVA